MLQTQNFEGVASGTTVTPGNSGTGGNTAYTTVNSTSVTVTYDNTHPAHGSNGLMIATSATSAVANALQTFTAVPTCWGRFYFWATDWTSSQNMGARLRAATTQACRICFDSTGHVNFHDTNNSSLGAGSVALSTATSYRCEFTCTPATTTTGAGTANIYLGDSGTLLDSVTTSTANFGTASISEYGIGLFTATANVNGWWFDDTVINDTGFPGPAVTAGPPLLSIRPIQQAVRRASIY